MWKEIQKMLVSLLWPALKEILKKVLREFSEWIVSKIKDVIQHRKTVSANKAEAKADEASERARSAKTQNEAHEHEAVAKVWREVAEMFREENDALKAELEALQRNSDEKSELAVSALAFDQTIDASGEEFKAIEGRPILQLDERNQK